MTGPGVVVTRDEGPDGRLTALLRDRGFVVHHWPVIRTLPPLDPEPLDRALASLSAFDWVVVTSRRAAGVLAERAARPTGPNIAAVGESTAAVLERAGWTVDLVPETQTGEALVEALVDRGAGPGARVLFPASSIARDAVPDGLEAAGAAVERVVAYRTEPAPLDRRACARLVAMGGVDVLTFTSPSTVRNLVRATGPELAATLGGLPTVVIGPTTAAAAEEEGFAPVVAEPHSLEGLALRVAEVAARERIEEG